MQDIYSAGNLWTVIILLLFLILILLLVFGKKVASLILKVSAITAICLFLYSHINKSNNLSDKIKIQEANLVNFFIKQKFKF